jgi:hypothetical protein
VREANPRGLEESEPVGPAVAHGRDHPGERRVVRLAFAVEIGKAGYAAHDVCPVLERETLTELITRTGNFIDAGCLEVAKGPPDP